MPPLATRRLGVELLDDPSGSPAAVETSLHNIARANRWFGGTAAVCWGLGRALRGIPSGARLISTTIATRSSPSLRDVRLVESFSGSIGKISAAV